jgi:ribosomal protein S18 acetylase RimI-like enzyme
VTVVVRPARPKDVDRATEVALAAWREGYRGVVPPDLRPDARLLAGRIRERIAQRGPPIGVGELDGKVYGWITFGASRDADAARSVGEVWALNVHPDAWRRGVGRGLVGYALERLTRQAFTQVTLWTFRDTPASRSFYEALGFRPDGATQRRDASGGAIEVRYRLAMAPSL